MCHSEWAINELIPIVFHIFIHAQHPSSILSNQALELVTALQFPKLSTAGVVIHHSRLIFKHFQIVFSRFQSILQ